jgi:hypothetical protein
MILSQQIDNLQNFFADKDGTNKRLAALEKAVSLSFYFICVD